MSFLGHYSFGLRPDLLKLHAEHRIAELSLRVSDDSVPVLVFTGFSGITFATALAFEFHKRGKSVDMILVRKQYEQSHGNPVHSSTSDFKDRTYVFVDDFISSGATFTRLDAVVSHYGGITLICEQEGIRYPTTSDFTTLGTDEYEYYKNVLRPKDAA
jgi:orotate phosphoribosyltransferase